MSHVHLSAEERFAIEQLLLYGCGYREIARKTGYHTAAILIGIILGPLLEQYFLRAMKMAQGELMVLFSPNLANAMWAALAASIALPYFLDCRRKRKSARAPS